MPRGRRNDTSTISVKFECHGDLYIIYDRGDHPTLFQYAGTIRRIHVSHWEVRDKRNRLLAGDFPNLTNAKGWYLQRRGITIHVDTGPPLVPIVIAKRDWDHADEWRAKVFRVLNRRNRAPAIHRLFTPIEPSPNSDSLTFQWPMELVDVWDNYNH
jgi:hypothetical protein